MAVPMATKSKKISGRSCLAQSSVPQPSILDHIRGQAVSDVAQPVLFCCPGTVGVDSPFVGEANWAGGCSWLFLAVLLRVIQPEPYFVHASTAPLAQYSTGWRSGETGVDSRGSIVDSRCSMLDTRPYESQACWLATAKGLGCEEWEGHSHSSIQTRDRRYIWCICRVFYFEALRILQNFQCVRCGIRVSKAAAVWAGGFRGGHGHGHSMTTSTPQGLDERERGEKRRGEDEMAHRLARSFELLSRTLTVVWHYSAHLLLSWGSCTQKPIPQYF